jgi:nucleoside triphosphatase
MTAEQQFPEPTVGALIVDPAGKLFLMKTHKWLGKYTLPGGHIELGESMEQALRREVKEETNLDIAEIEFLCTQEFIYDPVFWRPRHFIFFDFACKMVSGEVGLNDEAEEYIWIEPEKVFELPMDRYAKKAITEYLKRKSDAQIS